MAAELPLKESTIHDIYFDNSYTSMYQIPIYQRNYAWGEDQVNALVKDVKDSFDKNANTPYYIGTLVTYKRGDNIFEVIDGQQRLTTIYIILKALFQKLNLSHQLTIDKKLTYKSRRISAHTLKKLPDVGDEFDSMIKQGFDFAKDAIDEYVDDRNLNAFKDYFLNKVILIHYNVPKDVDLNHYFEVMNSRGEQLEKHEIVKSKLIGIIGDSRFKTTFARIWDSCAQMGCYIQEIIENSLIFSNDYRYLTATSFEDVSFVQHDKQTTTLRQLSNSSIGSHVEGDNIAPDNKFQPLIDFPNFLLIVLKLSLFKDGTLNLNDFQLDDKYLLEQFESALDSFSNKEKKIAFVKQFAFNLLKAKYLLDNYLVHHSLSNNEDPNQNPWMLERYYKDGNDTTPRNLSNSETKQYELVHLLSMFEVAFTPKTRKNYLFYILIHLFENEDVDAYLSFLRQLADKYFFDVYVNRFALNERNQPKPDAFDNTILSGGHLNLQLNDSLQNYRHQFEEIYTEGSSDISLFVFNYTDYRLWMKYAFEVRGKQTKEHTPIRVAFFNSLGCSDFGLETFDRFYFSRTRKSLEHFYPQANALPDKNADGITPTQTQINCFGNFAMIGADANSSGSNWDSIAKCEHYNSKKQNPASVASLKFKIMMQLCIDNSRSPFIHRQQGLEWDTSDIRIHQSHILNILFNS